MCNIRMTEVKENSNEREGEVIFSGSLVNQKQRKTQSELRQK
jgi:hypothetical protein